MRYGSVMKLLSLARLVKDVPGSEYLAGDVVTILDRAGKDLDGRQGWWIEKIDAENVTATSEDNLVPIDDE